MGLNYGREYLAAYTREAFAQRARRCAAWNRAECSCDLPRWVMCMQVLTGSARTDSGFLNVLEVWRCNDCSAIARVSGGRLLTTPRRVSPGVDDESTRFPTLVGDSVV